MLSLSQPTHVFVLQSLQHGLPAFPLASTAQHPYIICRRTLSLLPVSVPLHVHYYAMMEVMRERTYVPVRYVLLHTCKHKLQTVCSIRARVHILVQTGSVYIQYMDVPRYTYGQKPSLN